MITHWKERAPEAPFYAVIFISRKSKNLEGYEEMDDSLMRQVYDVPGFLGYSSKGTADEGIFISYWKDRDSIGKWRINADHKKAKTMAFEKWYDEMQTLICKVESYRSFIRDLAL